MNSIRILVFGGALLGLASAIPQGFEQLANIGSFSDDSQTVNEALDLSQAVIEAFADISGPQNVRASDFTSLQESQDSLMRIMKASRRTIEESEDRGFSVPAGAKERLEAAVATIPATFQFLQKLSELSRA